MIATGVSSPPPNNVIIAATSGNPPTVATIAPNVDIPPPLRGV